MGNAHPLTSKIVGQHRTATNLLSSNVSMQGYRSEMEDATLCLTPIAKGAACLNTTDDGTVAYVTGVFDGHSGDRVSAQLAENLLNSLECLKSFDEEAVVQMCYDLDKKILKRELEVPEYVMDQSNRDSGSTAVFCIIHQTPSDVATLPVIGTEVKRKPTGETTTAPATPLAMNQRDGCPDNLESEVAKSPRGGSRGLVCSRSSDNCSPSSESYIREPVQLWRNSEVGEIHRVVTVNVGDSRAIIISARGDIYPLTTDHKPDQKDEHARIVAAGGFVHMGRVDGQMSLSRAFGDGIYKSISTLSAGEQKLIPEPDITTIFTKPGDTLLIACDGLFELMTTEAVGKFVHAGLAPISDGVVGKEELGKVAIELLDQSLIQGSRDNMSLQLVHFPLTPVGCLTCEEFDEWYEPGILFESGGVDFDARLNLEASMLGIPKDEVASKTVSVSTTATDIQEMLPRLLEAQLKRGLCQVNLNSKHTPAHLRAMKTTSDLA